MMSARAGALAPENLTQGAHPEAPLERDAAWSAFLISTPNLNFLIDSRHDLLSRRGA